MSRKVERGEAAENRVRKERRSGWIAVIEQWFEKNESAAMRVSTIDDICYFPFPNNQSYPRLTSDGQLTQCPALSFARIYPSNRMPRLIKQLPLGSPHAHPC